MESRNLLINKHIPISLASIIIIVSLLVLSGWIFDIHILTDFNTVSVPMAPGAAIMLILLSLSVFLKFESHKDLFCRFVSLSISLIIIFFCIALLLHEFFDIDISLKLFNTLPHISNGFPVKHMSPLTATALLLAAIAIPFISSASNRRSIEHIADLFSVSVFAIGFIALIGYLYGTPFLYGETIIPVSIITACLLSILGVTMLLMTNFQSFILRPFTGDSIRSILLRTSIPVIFVLIFLEGWIKSCFLAGLNLNPALESAMIAAISMLVYGALIFTISSKIGNFVDQANQKREESEKNRRLLEKKYKAIFDNMPIGIFHSTFDGKFIDVNPATARILGYESPQELISIVNESSIADKLYVDPQKHPRIVDEVKNDNGWPVYENEYYRKDGSIINARVIVHTIKDLNGNPFHLEGFIEDMTMQKKLEEELESAAEKFATIFHNSPALISITNFEDGKFIDMNETFVKVTGYSRDEVIGHTAFELGLIAAQSDFNFIKEKLSQNKEIKNIENHFKNKYGKDIVILCSLKIIEIGGEKYILRVASDITERKTAEKRLEELNTFQQHLIDSLPLPVFYKDNKGKYLGVNKAFAAFYGIPKDQIRGMTVYDVTEKDLADLYSDIDMKLIKGNCNVKIYESSIKNFAGEIRNVIFHKASFPTTYGEPGGIIGVMIDVTELKRIEKNLKINESKLDEEKERLRVSLRSIGDAVITTDIDGNITLMNVLAEQITGWTLDEAQGKPLEKIFHIVKEQTHERIASPVEMVLKSGDIIELASNTMLISRKGQEIIIEDSAAPILDKNEETIGVVLVFRDITEKQKIEAHIQNTQKLESLGILAGGIAHDFNNLLNGIFGYLQMAQRHIPRDQKAYSYLEKGISVFERTKNLTHQLLTFAKGGNPVKKPINIANLLKNSITFSLSGSQTKTEFNIPDDIWPCEIDENQIGQVLDNIAINAMQAMPMGGIISIMAGNVNSDEELPSDIKKGNYIKISIRDNGKGIPKEHISKIFDPFFTTKNDGNGLGLTTSYSIIKKHGGYIEAESEYGKGAAFHIYLPSSADYQKKEEIVNSQDSVKVSRVLLMDDEEFIREIACEMLQSIGYGVELAENGNQAVELFKKAKKQNHPFDLVILDLTIPGGMGGVETIEKIHETDPDVNAIASSGYSDSPVMADPESFGFTASLNKPYMLEDLITVLKSVS